MVRALFNQDKVSGKKPCNLLRRCSVAFQSWNGLQLAKVASPNLSRHVRLVLTETGPRLVTRAQLIDMKARVLTSKCSYTVDFATLAFKWALRVQGHYRLLREHIIRYWLDRDDSGVYFIAPRWQLFWLQLCEDLWQQPCVQTELDRLMSRLADMNDFISLTIDGCVKVALHIQGIVPTHARSSDDIGCIGGFLNVPS